MCNFIMRAVDFINNAIVFLYDTYKTIISIWYDC
jgi:hypothetical protein